MSVRSHKLNSFNVNLVNISLSLDIYIRYVTCVFTFPEYKSQLSAFPIQLQSQTNDKLYAIKFFVKVTIDICKCDDSKYALL